MTDPQPHDATSGSGRKGGRRQDPHAPRPAPSDTSSYEGPPFAVSPLDEPPRPTPGRATFLRSFVYAWQGLTYAFRTQRNARIHLVLALLALAVGIALRVQPTGMAIVFVAITFVFITEMLNTVAEAIVDMVTQEYHPLAKTAKDVAAGAVLLSAMLAVVIGLLVFGPPLWVAAMRAIR